mmetsp:Transcript_17027/g.46466  ORF Transcript_17027/g.46466 Transcript_17027/m.46466 type:complete len:91 (-) Transcript_17027:1311-1583(-)
MAVVGPSVLPRCRLCLPQVLVMAKVVVVVVLLLLQLSLFLLTVASLQLALAIGVVQQVLPASQLTAGVLYMLALPPVRGLMTAMWLLLLP